MKQEKRDECCSTSAESVCCKVEALVSVDERGQMVLPKELREKANIHAGDKLAVTCWEKDGKICCISLTKAEDLVNVIKDTLGPVMREILQK